MRRLFPRRLFTAVGAALALYALSAYLLVPFAWTHFGRLRRAEPLSLTAYTREGFPGDPVNLVLVGNPEDVGAAFAAAGWRQADRMTPRTAARAMSAFLFKKDYPAAPVSRLYYGGRAQDLAFEKQDGPGDRRRHHVRLWRLEGPAEDGRPQWAGAASYDASVKLDRRTGRFTHRIAPDVDAEREFLAGDLSSSSQSSVEGPPRSGKNGGGDRYRTDGAVRVLVLGRP